MPQDVCGVPLPPKLKVVSRCSSSASDDSSTAEFSTPPSRPNSVLPAPYATMASLEISSKAGAPDSGGGVVPPPPPLARWAPHSGIHHQHDRRTPQSRCTPTRPAHTRRGRGWPRPRTRHLRRSRRWSRDPAWPFQVGQRSAAKHDWDPPCLRKFLGIAAFKGGGPTGLKTKNGHKEGCRKSGVQDRL